MQLQSSLFSREVLLGLHDFSIQSTVVFLIINFLTSYFCKRLSFFICKFCQQALLIIFSFVRGFSCAVSGFRHPAADEASRYKREKTSAEGCRSVLPKSSCFDSCFDHNPIGWSAAICFSCLSAWLVPIFFLRYRHKNKKMTRKIMFYPVLIQKQRELVYCYQTRGWV